MTAFLPFGIEIIFRHPGRILWAWGLLVILAVVFWEWRKRKRALRDPWILLHLSTSRLPGVWKRISWWTFFFLAAFFLLFAYAGPERVKTVWEPLYERIRITFLFDASISMKQAEDAEPNRLEAAKGTVRDLAFMLRRDEELKGNYHLALIPFSGAALPYYLTFTISQDEFLSHLDALDVDVIKRKGTSVWAAIRAYDEMLLEHPAREKGTMDLGILISDGGKEEGKAERALLPRTMAELRDPYRAARWLMSGERITIRSKEPVRKVILNTIGVGKAGSAAPMKKRDKDGNFLGFLHVKENDPTSPVLTTELDEGILREIAERGGGAYGHFADREALLREFKKLVIGHRQETERIPLRKYESVRAWFLVPAFTIFYFLFGYGGWLLRIMRRVPLLGRIFQIRTVA